MFLLSNRLSNKHSTKWGSRQKARTTQHPSTFPGNCSAAYGCRDNANKGSQSIMKLTYFNLRHRAEPIRYILTQGGIPFEDERLDHEQWSVLKPREFIWFGLLKGASFFTGPCPFGTFSRKGAFRSKKATWPRTMECSKTEVGILLHCWPYGSDGAVAFAKPLIWYW